MSKVLAKSRITGGTLVDAAIAHISSDGSSHGFINQNVTTNATPTFEGICINNAVSTDLIDFKTSGSNVAVNTAIDMQLNKIINIGAPTNASDVASKNYVDAVARGLDWKDSVRVASNIAAVLTTDFQNGNTVDFITIVTGDRILIKDQSAGVENGIYLVEATGTPTRAADFAVGSNVAGAAVTVEQGTTSGDSTFICTNDSGSDIVGTDALTFTSLGGGITFTAGDGVQLVSSVLSIDKSTNSGLRFTSGELEANVSTGLEIVSDAIRIASSAAGNGLTGGGGSALSVNLTANTYFVTTLTELSTAISDITTNGFPAKVLVAPGTYTFTARLTVPDDTTIEGSGMDVTILQTLTNINIFDLGDNVTLKNLTFEGNNTTGPTLDVPSQSDILITQCRFTNKNDHAINMTSVNRLTIANCQFESTAGNDNSIRLASCTNSLIHHNTFLNCSGANFAITLLSSTYIVVDSNFFDTCDPITISGGDNSTIINNVLLSPLTTLGSINTGNGNHVTIKNNQISNGAGAGIVSTNVISVEGVIITENLIENPTNEGIAINNSTTLDCVIQDNYISENGTQGGIRLFSSVGDALITGNKIINATATNINWNISTTGNDRIRIIDNNARLSITSTQTITAYTSHLLADTSGGAVTATIPDLTSASAGFKLYIELTTAGNDLTITPSSFRDGTSVVMDTAAQVLTLEWSGEEWFICDSSSNFATLRVRSGVHFVENTTDLNAAITAVASGGKIVLGPGTFTLTTAITVPDNVTIEGSGVEVTTLAVSTNISILVLGSNVTLKNLQFEGNNTTADGITASSETDIVISHCRFTNKNANAISFTSVTRAQITDCQFESTATNENSITLLLCNHVVISSSSFLTCSRGAVPLSTVRFDTCTFCTMSECVMQSCDAIEVSAGTNINILNNILQSPVTTDAAINVGGSSPNFTSVIGNQVNASAGIAISMASTSSSRGLKVIGNTVDTPTGIGIELISGASSTDFECVVQGNTIRNNGAGGGISFTETNANSISAVVSGNQISNTTNDNFSIPSTNQKSRIIDNNAELSVTSTQTINEYTTHVIADTSGGAVTATIPDLGSSSAGFKLTIELETAGNDLTITPTSFRDGTSVVMDTAAQVLTLEWSGEEWIVCDSSSNFATLRVRSGVHFVENITDLNAAITEVASGGKIILGPGSFTVTATITVPTNVTIEGSGIDVSTIVTGVASTIFSSSGDEVAIKNLTIDRGTFTATGINFSGDQCLVENCRFTGSGSPVGTSITTTGAYNKITLCVFDGVPALTLVFNDTGSVGTIVTDNSFVITGTSGTTMFSHGTHIRFSNNYISGGSVGCHYSSASEHNSIIGNTFLSIDTRCVRLIGTEYVNITGNSFRNASLQQIEMTTTARYINISSNTFRSATADAIGIESSSTDISIADNAFSACAIGIDYDGTTVTIVGNTFNGCTTEAINVGTSGCVIKDNVFDSNTQAIDIAASVNDCIVTGNRVTGTATQISVNATGNDRIQIKDNNYSLSVSTASPTIEPYITHLIVDTSSNTVGATIPDLTPASSGARLYIELETAGNDLTVTPTNFANGTNIMLDTAGDFITLQWDGRNWNLITNSTTANVQPTLTITPATLVNADTVNVQNPALLRQANECTLSTLFNITPNLSATVTSFEFDLPNRTTVTNNYDISALATGWFDSSGVPESIENLFVRADTANNGAFCKFTSSANAETTLTHYVSVLVRYNADA